MVISRTPFRMSFFGGGTDYREFYETHGGSVLSATFDKFCFVTVRDLPPFFEYKNQFTYSKIERFNEPDEVSHPLVREAVRYLKEDRIQISYDADLPARSGIGSSSSFAVGLLNSIHALRGKASNPYSLAKEAILLERVKCAESGGVQDQIAAAYGGLNRIDFDASGFRVRPLPIEAERLHSLNGKLLLFFSGLSRVSSDIAAEQISNMQNNIATLCAMKAVTDEAEKILLSAVSLDAFGELFDYTWQLKRRLSKHISNEEIENMYALATENGALGGKLLGAGGGGFMLLYVPEEKQKRVKKALHAYKYVPFSFEQEGSRIIYNKE